MSGWREFRIAGAEQLNALIPMLLRWLEGRMRWIDEDELSE